MGKRRKTLIAFGCLMAALLFIIFSLRTPEPSYQGRPLSDWLQEYQSLEEDPHVADAIASALERRTRATEAIRQMGTNSLPLLLKWFAYDAWREDEKRQLLYQKLPRWFAPRRAIMRFLSNDAAKRRAYGAELALVALGPDAKPAVPELGSFLTSTNSSYLTSQATAVLLHIGKEATPAFAAAVTDPHNPNRAFTINSLRFFGTKGSLGVPLLITLTGDPDPTIQQLAKDNLYKIAPEALTTNTPGTTPEAPRTALSH